MTQAGGVLRWIETQHGRPLWARLAWALAIAVGSFGVRVAVVGLRPGPIFEFFLPGVWLAAFMFGMRAGTVAALASGGLSLWWLTEPIGSFTVTRWTDAADELLLVLCGIATAAITEVAPILAQGDKR